MSFVITQRPINGISRWNAARNPIVYKGQRRDYVWSFLGNNGGFARIIITGVNVTAQLTIGKQMLVMDTAGTIKFTSTITGSVFSAGNTEVTFAQPYTIGSGAGGFANDLTGRPNYRLEIEVYDDANVLLNSKPLTYTPDSNANIQVNTSVVLNGYLTSDNAYDFTADVTTSFVSIPKPYIRFYIKYKEVWTGSANAATDDSAQKYYGVDGSRQVGSLVGNNLVDYVCFTATPGFWLTKFDVISAWEGYPIMLTALMDENFAANFFMDLTGGSGNVNGPNINNGGVGQMIDCVVKGADVNLYADAGLIRIYKTIGVTIICSSKVTKLKCPLPNSVMLIARNSLGGILQWVFDYNQVYTFTYADGSKAKRYRMQTNSLTLNEYESLQDFFTLGEIYRENITQLTTAIKRTKVRDGQQVYVLDKTTLKTTGVIVIPVDNQIETKNFSHVFELIIEFPEVL